MTNLPCFRLVPVPAFMLVFAIGCGAAMQPGGGDASAPPPGSDASPAGSDGAPPPGNDAATPPPSDAPAPPPGDDASVPEGTVHVASSCPTFTPCGGDPAGSWRYASVCVAPPLDALRAMCPGLDVSGTGTVRGAVTFAGGTVTRNVAGQIDLVLTIPASCAVVGCGVIGSALRSAGYPDATCTAASAGGCRCTATQRAGTAGSAGYAVAGNTITTTNGGTYDFCVHDGVLTYRETSPNPSEPWIADLARR